MIWEFRVVHFKARMERYRYKYRSSQVLSCFVVFHFLGVFQAGFSRGLQLHLHATNLESWQHDLGLVGVEEGGQLLAWGGSMRHCLSR